MRMLPTLLLGLFAIVGNGCSGNQDAVTMRPNPEVGDVRSYVVRMTYVPRSPAARPTIVISFEARNEIIEVHPDGSVKVRQWLTDWTVLQDGRDITDAEDAGEHTSTLTFGPNGDLLPDDSIEGTWRYIPARTFIHPEEPVSPGDQWQWLVPADPDTGIIKGESTFTYAGTEKLSGQIVYKVTMRYTELKGSERVRANGTYWISTEDMRPVKTVLRVSNVYDFDDGYLYDVEEQSNRN
ncbi:MAG: hypothetical protein IH851_04120 [Armatimonadetes bacterium]|nr:hypothetical protein [Armatimonadota bacterium]